MLSTSKDYGAIKRKSTIIEFDTYNKEEKN